MKTIWAMTVACEQKVAIQESVDLIYRAYPTASIVLIADRIRSDLMDINARFVQSTPMKNQASGALWWDRLFREGLKEQGELIFKIDPDAHVNRPLKVIPAADCFGTLLGKNHIQEHIQGGCQGFWRSAAERIFNSQVLLDDAYKDWHTWAFGGGHADTDFGPTGWADYLSTDRINMHVLKRLNMTWDNHPDMSCYYFMNGTPIETENMTSRTPTDSLKQTQSLAVNKLALPAGISPATFALGKRRSIN